VALGRSLGNLNLIKVVRGISKCEIKVRAPKSPNIVIFDKTIHRELEVLFSQEKIAVFDPRYERVIYLLTMCSAWIKWIKPSCNESFTHYYFAQFLRETRPKLVVSGGYMSRTLYSVRLSLQSQLSARFVVFQNGLWDDRELPPTQNSLVSGDIVYCVYDSYVKAWSSLTNGPKISAISTAAAKMSIARPVSDPKSRQMQAAWISVWRNQKTSTERTGVAHSEVYALEIELLKPLMTALKTQGLGLTIIGARKQEDASEERSFYEAILGDSGWEMWQGSSKNSVYRELGRYALVTGAGSTLLYECMSALQRVMFLDTGSVEAFRHPFLFPDHEVHRNSSFLLKASDVATWGEKIKSFLELSEDKYVSLVTSTIGAGPVNASLEQIARDLNVSPPLIEGEEPGTSALHVS